MLTLMLRLLAGALLLGGLYAAFHHWGRKPYAHPVRLGELERFVRIVLRRGGHGGHLLIRPVGAATPFIQLRKVLETGMAPHLEVGFPLAPWATAAYPLFQAQLAQAQLAQADLAYAVLPGQPGDVVQGFVAVDCAQDVAMASRVLGLAGQAVGWAVATPLRLTLHGVSPEDVVIGEIAERAP